MILEMTQNEEYSVSQITLIRIPASTDESNDL